MSKKIELIKAYAAGYNVVCVGCFPNYDTTEKCEFCPKPLIKRYYYFQCTKKNAKNNEEPVTFYTGPDCGKELAEACNIGSLPHPFTPFKSKAKTGIRNRADSSASSLQENLLPINKQFLDALYLFVTLKKRKPSAHIAEMICKTYKYGARSPAFPKQIISLSNYIAKDFDGHTLTAMLASLAEEQSEQSKIFDFCLLHRACEENGVQSYY